MKHSSISFKLKHISQFISGYTNPNLIQNFSEINNTIPLSPPPTYEHVLEEVNKNKTLSSIKIVFK